MFASATIALLDPDGDLLRVVAVGQDVLVLAPGVLEGVGQDRHRREVAAPGLARRPYTWPDCEPVYCGAAHHHRIPLLRPTTASHLAAVADSNRVTGASHEALSLAVVAHVILFRSAFGLEIRAVGLAPNAAWRYNGATRSR